MINIIKTAIITIIISFISGLLLEYYKNLAPRILCNIGKGTPVKLNNKRIYTYILNVRNISNKTIHDINLNVQESQNNLKIADSKITRGLKFDYSIKDSILDVDIPFLSKNDEFSVTLYVENQTGKYKKPVITIRSPEKFKRIDSVSKGLQNGKTTIFKNKIRMNKKAIITVVSIILVMAMGVLVKGYFQGKTNNIQEPNAKIDIQKQPIDAKKSVEGTTKNTSKKASRGGITRKTHTRTLTKGTTKNTHAKTLTNETTKNADIKTSTNGTTKNTNTSTNGITGETDTKTSTNGTSKDTDAKTSTNGTTKDTHETTGN